MSLVLSFLFNTASNLFDSCAKPIILMKSKNLTRRGQIENASVQSHYSSIKIVFKGRIE